MARPFGTLKYRTVDELEKAIDEYFNECDGKPIVIDGIALTDKSGKPVFTPSKPYTLEGLALHLEIDEKTLFNYGEREDYFPTINRARLKCRTYAAERLFDKDGIQGAKFYVINNSERMGGLKYAEKQELSVDGQVIVFGGENELED